MVAWRGRNRVSAERVISGPGLADIFEYLLTLHPELDNHPITSEFHDAARADKPVVVATHAEEGDILCAQAVSMLMTAYGAEAGNVALKFIPLGGLYIAGGLAPKNKVRLGNFRTVMTVTRAEKRFAATGGHTRVFGTSPALCRSSEPEGCRRYRE